MKKQQGFTLIEIIAVLVILGILAAVAIPKYNQMQDQARVRGAEGIMAGALSQLSLSYSEALLNNIDPGTLVVADECNRVAVTGDYQISCTATGTGLSGNVDIAVTSVAPAPALITPVEETWESPET